MKEIKVESFSRETVETVKKETEIREEAKCGKVYSLVKALELMESIYSSEEERAVMRKCMTRKNSWNRRCDGKEVYVGIGGVMYNVEDGNRVIFGISRSEVVDAKDFVPYNG